MNRFHLVAQRLRRNKLFRHAQFAGLGGGAAAAECELTELKAMLGVVDERRYVAGFLTQACGGFCSRGAVVGAAEAGWLPCASGPWAVTLAAVLCLTLAGCHLLRLPHLYSWCGTTP